MKDLIFLPDRVGKDEVGQQSGFVRVGASGDDLQCLVDRLVLPPKDVIQKDHVLWRGVLALALLCDAWPDACARVQTVTVDGTTSRFASWVISARAEQQTGDALHLVLLEAAGRRKLLGVADAHAGLLLPAAPSDFDKTVPGRAAWYDAENQIWQDPVPCLNEHERAILLARLTMMGLDTPEAEALKADLAAADKDEVQAVQDGDAQALKALEVRIQAVCGLQGLDAFSLRQEPCAVTADNPLVRLFSAVDVRYAAERTCATYLWHGVPFARTSAVLGLTGVQAAAQETVLKAMEEELALLESNSTRWNARCAAGIAAWMAEQDAALLPNVQQKAEEIRLARMARAREMQQTVQLTWPWDPASGAVKYLLKEALGEKWMRGAENPFADYLTKLTGRALGDHTLQHCCACADGVLLPPLSKEMAACVAAAQDGEGLAADMVRFDPREDGGIDASFLLRGAGEVRMMRTYPVEEMLVLGEEASPSVAVWPCLPIDAWRAYHVFVRGGDVTLAALSDGQWKTLETADGSAWQCLHTEEYPACLCVLQGEACLGVLPNALPRYEVELSGDAQASIDMGDSATAAVVTIGSKRLPMGWEDLTRMLVMPQEMQGDAFLQSLTPRELTPSAVLLTGEGDELFEDGYVYIADGLDALGAMAPGSVCTRLKWRADDRSVRARRILLHQVMLGVSLTAVLGGARSIRWRVTVADEMADEGRNALLNLVDELSINVAQETGLLLKDGKFAVTWAEEAAALQAYLRTDGGMRGSFAVLDIGGSSTKLHLWMQGKSRPLSGAVLLEGASTALLGALKVHPEWLTADFADSGDEALMAAAEMVCGQLKRAGETADQADKALMMLDALLENHKQAITQHLYYRFNAQQPAYMQAILLEMYAAALFNVGLMLEQVGNDTNITHLFPADLPICLTGRGAWLLDTLTPQLRNGLQRIAHEPMQLRHPVRTVTLRPAMLPAMGTALGMSVLKDTQNMLETPFIRTRQSFSELMRMLMVQLMQCYPLHVWTLHPGLFDQWGNLTATGEDAIRRTASECYGEGEDIPASVMRFIAHMPMRDVVPVQMISPGE